MHKLAPPAGSEKCRGFQQGHVFQVEHGQAGAPAAFQAHCEHGDVVRRPCDGGVAPDYPVLEQGREAEGQQYEPLLPILKCCFTEGHWFQTASTLQVLRVADGPPLANSPTSLRPRRKRRTVAGHVGPGAIATANTQPRMERRRGPRAMVVNRLRRPRWLR